MPNSLVMKPRWVASAFATLLLLGMSTTLWADDAAPGATVESLLLIAKERNPDYAAMRHEVLAATERAAVRNSSRPSVTKTSPKPASKTQHCCRPT